MTFNRILKVIITSIILHSCNRNDTTQVGDDTFVHNDKVYKIIDNELTEIGDLNNKKIRQLSILKPQQKSLGEESLSFVKDGAYAVVSALYRGNFLYFKITIEGLNDLRDSYTKGFFILDFTDEYGFVVHSTEIKSSDLTAIVGEDGKPKRFEFYGKTEMSTEINKAITKFDVSSSVRPR